MLENLQSQTTKEKPLNILEQHLSEETRELARRIDQGHIDSREGGDIGATVISVDKVKLNHKRKMPRTLYTVFGEIKVNRIGYSRRGHNSLFPLDAQLNLPNSAFSYGLQQMVTRESIKGSFEECLLTIERQTGVKIGKRQALEIVKQCACDFDAFYQEQSLNVLPDAVNKVPIMVLTTDAKGIVMRTDSLREETKKRLFTSNHKLKHRLSKGEKRNRMAQVASIYFIDRFVRQPEDIYNEFLRKKAMQKRPRPLGKRIWASVEKEASVVISELFDEAYLC